MKRSDLKEIIKECVRETLFEEGVLSDIIAEVAFGITKAQSLLVENQQPQKVLRAQPTQPSEEEVAAQKQKLLETKKKMLDAIGNTNMQNVFEGTTPLRTQGAPNAPAGPGGALTGFDPNDSGVDISKLFSLAGNKWNALK
jgi:hypothetical protein